MAQKIFRLLVENENEGIKLWKENAEKLILTNFIEKPMVDVLSCVYNAADYISHALDSILLQSYQNLRLIVVNDGSNDGTSEILKQYAKENTNIILIENEVNKGIVFSANKGLEYCSSPFIARMDLDDLNHPLRIEKQIEYLSKHLDTAVVSSWLRIFDEVGKTKDVSYREDFEEQKITQLFFSPLAHAASTFRASIIKELGYNDSFNDRGEDYHLFFRIMQTHKTAVLQECLYLYRTHSQQVTNSKHAEILSNSTFKILKLIFNGMGLQHSDEDIFFHIKYLVYAEPLPDKETWNRFDIWLNKIIKANRVSCYFNHKKLIQFLRHNFWQTAFNQFYKKNIDLPSLLKNLFNLNYIGSKSTLIKIILKKIKSMNKKDIN